MIYIPNKRTKVFAILMVLLSCMSSPHNVIGNTYAVLLVQYIMWCMMIYDISMKRDLFFSRDYIWCAIFLMWAFINAIRGVFIAENYWEYKQLGTGVLMCSLPIIAYFMKNPSRVAYLLNKWNKWFLIIYFGFFFWKLPLRYEFWMLPFIVLYLAYYKLLSTNWKILVAVFFFLTFLDLGARSFIVKMAISFLVASGIYFREFINDAVFKFLHWLIYSLSILLLILGITGNFNVLEDLSQEGEKTDQDAEVFSDTRSFIYQEVITDALDRKYVMFGVSPARGNYSPFFYDRNKFSDAENLNGKKERFANELVHLNIFTWLGLIGIFLYSMIYFRASYMAVYKSKSFYMKMMGLMIAAHWIYGWIEDVNTFTIQNFWLWLMIAMGLSGKFREMTDRTFEKWFSSIFSSKKGIVFFEKRN